MTARPVRLRELAARDVEKALDDYLREGGTRPARGFVAALERALRHIGRYPESGSPRYARLLDIPDLRFWPLGRSPYLVFYLERRDYVDVWRVLHAQRDLPGSIKEESAPPPW